MANIIIPPEHQSAPKVPRPIIRPDAPVQSTKAPVVHTGDYDNEMDLPEYRDARVQAALSQFEQRVMSVSPQQTKEALSRKFEENVKRAKSQRWDGQERWQGRENVEMRLTRLMHPEEFIRRLRAAGVKAERLPDNRDYARVWLNTFSRVGRIGINAWVKEKDADGVEVRQAQTITTLQYPYGPEYSIMRFNEYNVPTNERYRGWRTVLLNLILKNVITEDEALRAFGPAEGPAAQFYREQLFHHRKICMGLTQ